MWSEVGRHDVSHRALQWGFGFAPNVELYAGSSLTYLSGSLWCAVGNGPC